MRDTCVRVGERLELSGKRNRWLAPPLLIAARSATVKFTVVFHVISRFPLPSNNGL